MKNVVFYEKLASLGHRRYIAQAISQKFRTDKFKFVVYRNNRQENCLESLIALRKEFEFDHCHLLTLDDCYLDFKDIRFLSELTKYNIGFSGTLFHFDYIQLGHFLWSCKNHILHKRSLDHFFILELLRRKIVKRILIPDERVGDFFLYPFYNHQLGYLADFVNFKVPDQLQIAEERKKIGISENEPVFLMFGQMADYKGLKFLIAVLEKRLVNSPVKTNFIIAGKINLAIKNYWPDTNINVVKINRFVDDKEAAVLFSVSDCVLMPFEKNFKISSGTYVLACNFGKFIITTDVGVLGWRTRKYKNGFLFKADNIMSLAEKINEFIRQRKRIAFPVEGSLAYAKNCSFDFYNRRLEDAISQCLYQKSA